MARQGPYIKILAVIGTTLAWIPILAPVLFSFAAFFGNLEFRFDYLMPAELFPVALPGGGILVWAALRTRLYDKFIVRAYGISIASLMFGQILAVATGLASGAIGPSGWQWVLVLLTIAVYTCALVGVGAGGMLLTRKLLRGTRVTRPNRS